MKYLLLLFGFLYTCVADSTEHVDQSFQFDNPVNYLPYRSAKPYDYLMFPDERQLKTRDYKDGYAAIDISGYDPASPTLPNIVSDCSAEEYFEMVVTNSASSSFCGQAPPSGFSTLGPSFSNQRIVPLRNMSWAEMGGATSKEDKFSSYSIKMTAGLIFRDHFSCNQEYEHLRYNSDESEYRNSAGAVEVVKDSDYCFFLYIPSSATLNGKEAGPYLGKVNPSDGDSLAYIKTGLSPFLPLPDSLKSLLEMSEEESIFHRQVIHYRSGRYFVPMPDGRITLPQNGFNVLYDRMDVSRIYHQDRREKKVEERGNNDCEKGCSTALTVLGIIFTGGLYAIRLCPADFDDDGNEDSGWGWDNTISDTADWLGAVDPVVSYEQYNGSGDGAKTEPFGSRTWPCLSGNTSCGYLYFPDNGAAGIRYNASPVLNHPAQEGIFMMSSAGDGVFRHEIEDADGNVVAEEEVRLNEDGMVPLNAPDPAEVKSFFNWKEGMRLFQYLAKTPYNISTDETSESPLTQETKTVEDPSIKPAYDHYKPLFEEMSKFWELYGLTDDNDGDVKRTFLTADHNEVQWSLGERDFKMSKMYKQFVDIYLGFEDRFKEISALSNGFPLPSTCPVAQNYVANLFSRTTEGKRQLAHIQEIADSLSQVEGFYAEKWFSDTFEYDSFKGQFVSLYDTAKADCETRSLNSDMGDDWQEADWEVALHNGIGGYPGVPDFMMNYGLLDSDPYVAGPFKYYTSKIQDGKQLLIFLGILQGYSGSPAGDEFYNYLTDTVYSQPPTARTSDFGAYIKEEMNSNPQPDYWLNPVELERRYSH